MLAIPNSPIGQPLEMVEGQFTGQIIRAQLEELQTADRGRKWVNSDRRPLDPPPVVQVRLLQVHHTDAGCQQDTEVDYREVDCHSLLCYVDLFKLPMGDDEPELDGMGPGTISWPSAGPSPRETYSVVSPPIGVASFRPQDTSLSLDSMVTLLASDSNDIASSSLSNYEQWILGDSAAGFSHLFPDFGLQHPIAPLPGLWQDAGSDPQSKVIAYLGDCQIRESMKCTEDVAGKMYVVANRVPDWEETRLMFVFSDLSVRRTGMFFLRYRFFDVCSKARGDEPYIPVLAECYGGPFQVYSVKKFPGLQASTDLTKYLSALGVRSNQRHKERKRHGKTHTVVPKVHNPASTEHALCSYYGYEDGGRRAT